jgi:transposase
MRDMMMIYGSSLGMPPDCRRYAALIIERKFCVTLTFSVTPTILSTGFLIKIDRVDQVSLHRMELPHDPIVDDPTFQLVIQNLDFSITKEQVIELVRPLALPITITMPGLVENPRGTALLTFACIDDGQKVITELNGRDILGRILVVKPVHKPKRLPIPSIQRFVNERDGCQTQYKEKPYAIYQALIRGRGYDSIQSEFKCSPNTVRKVAAAIERNEPPPLAQPRGRPSKKTEEVVTLIRNETAQNPSVTARDLQKDILSEQGVRISPATINEVRQSFRFEFKKPRLRPTLTANQKTKRVEFCRKALNGPINWEAEVVISDESRFGLNDDSSRIWVQRGVYSEQTFRDQQKFNKSVMVWGAIGVGYKSELIFIDGTMKAADCRHMLDSHNVFEGIHAAYQNRPVHFQQDGAPPHTAKETVRHIREKIDLIDDWPAANGRQIVRIFPLSKMCGAL